MVCATVWLIVAIVLGVALGAVIGRADRQQQAGTALIPRHPEIDVRERAMR